MMDAFEVAWQILDLPAFIGADLLARQTTARASPFCFAQLVDIRDNRKVLEVGQIALFDGEVLPLEYQKLPQA
jgi:hypothetical protein